MRLGEEQIRKLLDLIESIEEKELRIEAGDMIITIKEGDGVKAFKLTPLEEIPIKKEAPKEEEKKEEDIVVIKAPSAGIFYRRPEPNAPPYVEDGSIVEPGDTLALIEVMKSFGPVVSEVKGEVIEILAEDGKTVEYGQTLFLIKRM